MIKCPVQSVRWLMYFPIVLYTNLDIFQNNCPKLVKYGTTLDWVVAKQWMQHKHRCTGYIMNSFLTYQCHLRENRWMGMGTSGGDCQVSGVVGTGCYLTRVTKYAIFNTQYFEYTVCVAVNGMYLILVYTNSITENQSNQFFYNFLLTLWTHQQ